MPSLEKRMLLFYDFLKAHAFLLTRAREAVIYGIPGGPEAFDFDRTYLLIALSYRRDCGGNPARAFRVVCVDLVRYNEEKFTDNAHKSLGAGRARVESTYGARSLGSLKIMFRTAERNPEEDIRRWDVQPVFKPVWQAQKYNLPKLPRPVQCLGVRRHYESELMSASEHGLVVRADTDAGRCIIGELVKSGTSWRWERLSPAQLRERGLPADFNDLALNLVSNSPASTVQ